MLETGADEPMSLCARGDIREPFGLVGGGSEIGASDCSSGVVGESRGLVISCSSAMVGSKKHSQIYRFFRRQKMQAPGVKSAARCTSWLGKVGRAP